MPEVQQYLPEPHGNKEHQRYPERDFFYRVLYALFPDMVEDLVRCYGGGKTGRTIVFVERKASADEMASAIGESTGARALHGDVPQATREVTLSAFRNGKFNVLVATDVAARGLDISGIELVIQSEPPKDAET